MTRGKGIYDDEDDSGEGGPTGGGEAKDPDRDTPDVEKDSSEPTA